jgi:hypothetical protein
MFKNNNLRLLMTNPGVKEKKGEENQDQRTNKNQKKRKL